MRRGCDSAAVPSRLCMTKTKRATGWQAGDHGELTNKGFREVTGMKPASKDDER